MARRTKKRDVTRVATYPEPRTQKEILGDDLIISVTPEERRQFLQWVRDYSNSLELGRPGVRNAGYYELRNKPWSFLRPDYTINLSGGGKKEVSWSGWAKHTLIRARKRWIRGERGPDALDPALLSDSGNPDVVEWTTHEGLDDWAADIPALQLDPWKGQPKRVVMLCEKEGMSGIIENACDSTLTPYMCCGGDATLMQKANVGRWLAGVEAKGLEPVALYAGDHDMQGVNMDKTWVRDVAEIEAVTRVAITLDQARKRRLPMESASDKLHRGDSLSDAQKGQNTKVEAYVNKHGDGMIELDELNEYDLRDLVRDAIAEHIDQDIWDEREEATERPKERIDELIEQLRNELEETEE
jgi:hypothetical protein